MDGAVTIAANGSPAAQAGPVHAGGSFDRFCFGHFDMVLSLNARMVVVLTPMQ